MSLTVVLIVNMVILIGLSSLNTLWGKPSNSDNRLTQIMYGIIFGLTSVLLMALAWGTETGVFYDARTVLIGGISVLYSPLTTLITVVIASLYRGYAGGMGAFAGVVIIIWTGILGVIFKYKVLQKINKNKFLYYYAFGIVVHFFLLFWHILIKTDIEFIINRVMILAPVSLTIYPLAVALLVQLIISNDKKLIMDDELKKSEEKYRFLFGSLPVGVFHFDSEGVIIDTNQMFAEIMNTDVEKLVGIDMKKLPNEKFKSELHKTLNGTVGRYKGTYESFLSGKSMFLDSYFYPTFEEGIKIGGVGIVQDITDLAALDERIKEVSSRDRITSFLNRKSYEEDIVSDKFDDLYPLSYSYLSIDNLQFFIDAMTYKELEVLLQNVAAEIMSGTPKDTTIYRISQNDFILISRYLEEDEVNEMLNSISEKLCSIEYLSVNVATTHFRLTKESKDVSWSNIQSRANTMVQSKRVYSKSFVTKSSIEVLLATLFEKSPRERAHSERVAQIATKVATAMGMSQEEIDKLKIAAVLHDIGKINIESSILEKPSKLTRTEFDSIKSHTVSGYRILSSVPEYSEISEIVLCHHERWDGDGYQSGLKGNEIPLASRIISIADSFDAMTNDRPYRKALTLENALQEIENGRESQFDPDIVKAFLKVYKTKDIN